MEDVSDRLWHPWLRIQRLLRAMLALCSDPEAWRQVKPQVRKALNEQRRRRPTPPTRAIRAQAARTARAAYGRVDQPAGTGSVASARFSMLVAGGA